jgi:hypothetical protein
MRVGQSARVVISDLHTMEGCCHDELGSDADRGQEGPGSSGVRRLTEWLKLVLADNILHPALAWVPGPVGPPGMEARDGQTARRVP